MLVEWINSCYLIDGWACPEMQFELAFPVNMHEGGHSGILIIEEGEDYWLAYRDGEYWIMDGEFDHLDPIVDEIIELEDQIIKTKDTLLRIPEEWCPEFEDQMQIRIRYVEKVYEN